MHGRKRAARMIPLVRTELPENGQGNEDAVSEDQEDWRERDSAPGEVGKSGQDRESGEPP